MNPHIPGQSQRPGVSMTLDKNVIEAFDKIAWREHKSRSQLVEEILTAYVKAHANANESFTVDKWLEDKDLQAYPTYGEELTYERLDKYDDKDLNFLKGRADSLTLRIERLQGERRVKRPR